MTHTILTNPGDSVGIGTSEPKAKVDIAGWPMMPQYLYGATLNIGGDLFFGNVAGTTGRGRISANHLQGFFQWNMYYEVGPQGSGLKSLDNTKPGYEVDLNAYTDSIAFKRYPAGSGFLAPETIMSLNKVTTGGFEVVVNGKLRATQVIGAVFQDIAEWVPATTQMPAGTVVVLNPDGENEVMPSNRAYDTSVAGVVSEMPGLILGIEGDSKAQIATYGRVKVRVDAARGAIRVGDLLVTSDQAGMAMRSQPIKVEGQSLHRPGTIIGKALQPLAAGQGEILVLLSMQ
jgi:hypothetical protein